MDLDVGLGLIVCFLKSRPVDDLYEYQAVFGTFPRLSLGEGRIGNG